jgi:hypothetical protein
MASGLRADAQGFLIGELIESGRDLLRATEQSQVVLKDLRTDVKAIARAIGVQVSTNVRTSRPAPMPRVPSGVQRTAGGNVASSGPRPVVFSTAVRGAPSSRSGGVRTSAPVVISQPRAANGRFVAGSGGSPALPSGGGSGGGSAGGGRIFSRMNDTLGRLASTLQAADNIDPTVNALKEVKDVVTPLGRGLFSVFGKSAERKKEVWYRRFLKALQPSGEKKSQPGSSGGGFLGGLFGGGAGGGGLLGRVLGAAGGAAGGGLLGGLLGVGKNLFKGGGNLLRRVPLLGALVAGGGALASVFGGGSRDEKYKGVGEAGGMLTGGMAGAKLGAVLGTMIAPGIGTAVGGFLGGVGGALLGETFGAKVGEWTKTLVDSDIPGKVVDAWKETTAFIGAAWDSLATDAKAAWDVVTTKAGEWLDVAKSGLETLGKTLMDAGNAVNGWIKDKTGVDVKETVGNAATRVGQFASDTWDKTKEVAKVAGTAAVEGATAAVEALTPNTVKRAIAAGSAAATQAKAGYDVARGNSTSAAAPSGALQQGARAAGGAAGAGINKVLATGLGYNITQNGDGAVTRQDGARNWRNNNPGNLEYNDYTRGLGAIGSDGRFAIFPNYATGRAAKASMLFDGKNYKDKTLTDAIARYAPPSENNTAVYQNAVLAAVGGKNKAMSEYTPAERNAIMDAMQKVEGYKVGKTTAIPSSQYAALGVASPSVPALAAPNVPSAVPASIPAATNPDDRMTQINSGAGAGRGTINVTVPEAIGQNVSDRGSAHVVTGGLGMR